MRLAAPRKHDRYSFMSAVEIAVEKVRRLDEPSALRLQERSAPGSIFTHKRHSRRLYLCVHTAVLMPATLNWLQIAPAKRLKTEYKSMVELS